MTGEREKAVEVRGLYSRTYPEDAGERNNLAYSYNAVGRFEKGIEEADAVIRLQSKMVYPYQNKARAFVRLNRFEEAKASIQDARAQQLDTTGFLAMLYEIASAESDPIALKHQIDAAAGRPDAFLAFGWQAQSAEFFGRRRAAQELRHQAVGPADRGDIADAVAQWEVTSATDAAVAGLCREARPVAARARQRALDQDALHDVGLVFAMCGDAAATAAVVDELSMGFPNATLTNGVALPLMRAALEIQRGKPAEAIRLLETTRPYERTAAFRPAYLARPGVPPVTSRHSGQDGIPTDSRSSRGVAPLTTLSAGISRGRAGGGDRPRQRREPQGVRRFSCLLERRRHRSGAVDRSQKGVRGAHRGPVADSFGVRTAQRNFAAGARRFARVSVIEDRITSRATSA